MVSELGYFLDVERRADAPAIAHLLDRQFGRNRHTRAIYQLRNGSGPAPSLSWVARAQTTNETLVGSIRYWPVYATGQRLALLGPLAVHADYQGLGIATALVRHSLAIAWLQNYPAVIVAGEPEFYHRFGFTHASLHGLTYSGDTKPLQVCRNRQSGRLMGGALYAAEMPQGAA